MHVICLIPIFLLNRKHQIFPTFPILLYDIERRCNNIILNLSKTEERILLF